MASLALLAIAILFRFLNRWWEGVADVQWILIGAALVVLIGVSFGVRGWWRSSRGDVETAAEIDERMNLSSRLSTALALANSSDPFACASVRDGASAATSTKVSNDLHRAFQVVVPQNTWVGLSALSLAVAVVLFVPALTSATPTLNNESLDELRADAQAQVDAIVQRVQSNPELERALAEAGAGELGKEAISEGLRSPEEIRRESARKVTEMAQRLEQVIAGEKAQSLSALEQSLSSLPLPTDGTARELAEALKQGDFKKASEALQKLAEAAEKGELDQNQRDQLEQLARAIEKSADAQEALRDALAAAGLDPDLANNPEAMKNAMQAAKGLSQAQVQALAQAAKAQKSAQQASKSLAKACQSCANGQGQGDGQQGAIGEGKEALGEFAKYDEMMRDAAAAKSMCQGGSGGPTQLAKGSDGYGNGPGMRGPGQGSGGEAQKKSTATGTRLRKEKVESRSGDVIARELIDVEPSSGEAILQLRDIGRSIVRGVEASSQDDPVPPHLQEAHRRYFGEMQRRIEKKTGKDPK
ncbi:MAG: hypothetical protein O2800_00810 [Planctomycetota bacterium]|nr:hypothetical protein [Planctomycetota bacterium]